LSLIVCEGRYKCDNGVEEKMEKELVTSQAVSFSSSHNLEEFMHVEILSYQISLLDLSV